ncbi:MAG: hypothetical protein LBR40_03055 [Bacilli bacterium]|jgi:hypothetical protein|nr:hypothetical protein [Bacilli bacterium]
MRKKIAIFMLSFFALFGTHNVLAFESSINNGPLRITAAASANSDWSTSFQVYLKAGETFHAESWFQDQAGDTYLGYPMTSVDPNQFDVSATDASAPGFDATAAQNACLNGDTLNTTDDGTHYVDIILKDSNGNIVDQTTGNDGLNLADPSDALDWTSAPVTSDGTYNVYIHNRAGLTTGIRSFSWAENTDGSYNCSGNVMNPNTYQNFYNWKFDAQNNGSDIPGRVWTRKLTLSQGDNFTTDLYTANDAGYQYKVSLNTYNGAESTIAFSSLGLLDGNGDPIDKSVWQKTGNPTVNTDISKLYKIFTEAPATDLPKDIIPDPIDSGGNTLAKVTGLSVEGANPRAGNILHYLDPAFIGTYKILIDTNNNGNFDDAVDVTLNETAAGGTDNGTATNPKGSYWNGLDGEGNVVPFTQAITAKIDIENISSIYFTFEDVETLGGIMAEQLNGSDAGNTTLYWDDSGYSGDLFDSSWTAYEGSADNGLTLFTSPVPLINYPLSMTGGIDSSDPNNWPDMASLCTSTALDSAQGVHGWCVVDGANNSNATWGNVRRIESWMNSSISAAALDATKEEIPADIETDHDHDGIPDAVEMGDDLDNIRDTDGDGTADWLDLDSDGDGIPDKVEALNSDGSGDPATPVDTDGDGIPDYLDLDTDGDNISDTEEAQVTAEDPDNPYTTAGDANNDGMPDVLDSNSDGQMDNPPVDSDEDGTPDYRDLDSDNDGIPDSVEAGDTDLDTEAVDSDGDGTPDYLDLDSDNDGIPDSVEKGEDGNNPVDTDGDGTPDYLDLDSDNDGIPDSVEKGEDGNNPVDTDGDGTPDYQDLDSDNDGIPDSVEKGEDGNNPVDTDGDGTPDYQDLDSDNDSIPDSVEALNSDGSGNPANPVDTDGDGVPDYRDIDSDNDTILDIDEVGPDPMNPIDSDGDGIPDYRDPANMPETGSSDVYYSLMLALIVFTSLTSYAVLNRKD